MSTSSNLGQMTRQYAPVVLVDGKPFGEIGDERATYEAALQVAQEQVETLGLGPVYGSVEATVWTRLVTPWEPAARGQKDEVDR